jgi:putative SOS response-associated peptidase YedK
MCGRFTLTASPEAISEAFPDVEVPGDLAPRYNVAPTQPIAVIANSTPNLLDHYVWGLIPHWVDDPKIGSRMINARSETLAEKPSFRVAYRRRRCLVLADGFFEWKKVTGQEKKQPMYLKVASREVFAFAGLWESWHSPLGDQVLSCTIITTEPNTLVEPIHNRMPVILAPEDYDLWLDRAERPPEDLQPLLKPYPADDMFAYPVSREVNKPGNDYPGVIEQVEV